MQILSNQQEETRYPQKLNPLSNSVVPTIKGKMNNINANISSCRISTGFINNQLLSPGWDKQRENQLNEMKNNIEAAKSPREKEDCKK